MTSIVHREELRPLRGALVKAAQREADALVADATARAAEILSAAKQAAEKRIASARAEGAADARRAATAELAAARLQARTIVLTARSSLDDELRAQVLQRVRELRDDVTYDGLRVALQHRGRALLGDAVACHEPATGGVVVEAAGRRIDASLDALAHWAVDTAIDAAVDAPIDGPIHPIVDAAADGEATT